jgi:hypothetical protein
MGLFDKLLFWVVGLISQAYTGDDGGRLRPHPPLSSTYSFALILLFKLNRGNLP